MEQKQQSIIRLVETGFLLAVSIVLGLVKLIDLPYGGSVTACSALPLLVISYRHGIRWGVAAGFAYALIKLILGSGNLSYCPTALAVAAVIVLDYLLAYTALGLGGLFRRRLPQTPALLTGALLTGGLRYVFHTIAGCTVWAGLSIPNRQALLYSLTYNATYMIPELLVTVLAAGYLSRALNLQASRPTRRMAGESPMPVVGIVLWAVGVVAGIVDLVLIFSHWQDAETGGFSADFFTTVPWLWVVVIAVVGALAFAIGWVTARRSSR